MSRSSFMHAIFGSDGAGALARAAEHTPELDAALFPRAILAWLQLVAPTGFEDALPGVPTVFAKFSKSETDDCSDEYCGEVTFDSKTYTFRNASLYQLAATLAAAIGVNKQPLPKELRNIDVQKLGKSMDILAKAHAVVLAKSWETLQKNTKGIFAQAGFLHTPTGTVIPSGSHHDISVLDPDAFDRDEYQDGFIDHDGTFFPRAAAHKMIRGHEIEPQETPVQSEEILKAELPGRAAAPKAPVAPTAPANPVGPSKGAVTQKKPKTNATLPKLGGVQSMAPPTSAPKPTLPSIKVGKSELTTSCPQCGKSQFHDNRFIGCTCFAPLAKSVTCTPKPDGILLSFGSDWDNGTVRELLIAIRGQ